MKIDQIHQNMDHLRTKIQKGKFRSKIAHFSTESVVFDDRIEQTNSSATDKAQRGLSFDL